MDQRREKSGYIKQQIKKVYQNPDWMLGIGWINENEI